MKEDAPTNSMSGVYSLNAPGFRVGPKDPARKYLPDIDGNFTDGIPGNPGDPFYLRPEGYWDGGSDWTTEQVPDASQDYLLEDPTGKSTSDLIAEDGTVKTFLPPNSRSFILGPLVDGYVPNHGYDNYSNIGYIQKDTRQFVLLARIQGQFTTDLHSVGARVWDGTAEQLTIYNSNFTLEMAEWFRDQITAGTFTKHVPYFYSGGVPQQPQSSADCPNCPPNMFGGATPGTSGSSGRGGGFGQGTPPNLGSEQGGPTSGNDSDAGGPFPNPNLPPPDNTNNNNNNNNNENNDTPPPPPPPPEDPPLPKGSLLAGFAAIDGVMAFDGLITGLVAAGGLVAWIAGTLLDQAQTVLGGLLTNFSWYPQEITALNNYARQRSLEMANAMATELSNQEWERQAAKGRERDRQEVKDANERLGAAEKELRDAKASGDQDRIDRANDQYDNALRNRRRVTDNASRNREQRRKERNKRGLDGAQPGGQGREKGATINPGSGFRESLVSVKRLIREQGAATPTPAPSGDGASGPQGSPGGGGRTYVVMEKNPTLSWLTGESTSFAGGFARGSVENGGLDTLIKGTNLSSQTIIDLSGKVDRAEVAQKTANQAASDHWTNVASPKITSLLAQTQAYLNSPGWGFLRAMGTLAEIDQVYKVYEGYQRRAITASYEYLSANRALGRYVQSGRPLTRLEYDPFSLDDVIPDEPDSDDEDKDKDELIQDQLDKLMQDNSELAQAQALNKLKALGWGALMAGGIIVGAAVLAKPAIVGALGVGVVRTLRAFIKTKPIPRPPSNPNTPGPGQLNQKGADFGARMRNQMAKDHGTTVSQQGGKTYRTSPKDPDRGNSSLLNSYEPNRRKKILSEIRKPVKVKEGPTKYKMNFSGKYSSQNTPDKTASQASDNLVAKANERGSRWRMDDKRWSGYETTEKMNIIHDKVGHGSQYWDRMLDEAKEKNNWRSREVQEELNKIAHEKAMLKENPDFRSPFGNLNIDTAPTTPKNKKNFDAVTKIKNMAADKATKKMMTQIIPEYPSKPPTVPDEVTGLHPKLKSGENTSAYYKRLDPTSADSMPDAEYPQIDDLRDKAKKKPK